MATIRDLKVELYEDSLVGTPSERAAKRKILKDFIDERSMDIVSKGPKRAKEDLHTKHKDKLDEIDTKHGKFHPQGKINER